MIRKIIFVLALGSALLALSGCISRDYSWSDWHHNVKGESTFYKDKINCIRNSGVHPNAVLTSYVRDCLRTKDWRLK